MSTLHIKKRSGQRRVEILVGPIASGKSTFVRSRVREGWVVINDDDICMAVHGGQYGKYDRTLKPLYKSVENTMLQMAIALGRDVVIDRPNVKRQSRARYIGIAQSCDVDQIVAITFPVYTPEIHAERRMRADDRGLAYEAWLDAATYQLENYNIPTEDEGFTEVRHLVP